MKRINRSGKVKLKSLLPLLAVFFAVIQGCASAVIRPIDESKKDVSGTFDGPWKINVQESAGTQYGPSNWEFNCNGKAGSFGIFFVGNGVATLRFDNTPHSTFVNGSGQFRFEVPLATKATASGTSDGSVDRGSMTMILSGSLQQQKGFLTWGIAEFANNGCTSKVKYESL